MDSTINEIAEDLYTKVLVSEKIKEIIENQDLSNNEKDKQIRIVIVNANSDALHKLRKLINGDEPYERIIS